VVHGAPSYCNVGTTVRAGMERSLSPSVMRRYQPVAGVGDLHLAARFTALCDFLYPSCGDMGWI